MKVTFKNTIHTLLIAFVCFLSGQFSFAQNGVRIAAATGTADASAMLDVVSTTKGFLTPRMTAAQRTAIVSPATGLIVYQTDGAQGLYYFTGPTGSPANTWVQLSAGALSGAGTTNYVAKWTSTSAIGNSQIFDNGTAVGISSATPTANMLLDVNGNMLARKYVVQDQVDGTNARGIWMWDEGDANWGIYMAQSGAGKSLGNGVAATGAGGFAAHAIRFRVNAAANQGFIFENNSEQALFSIKGDDGMSYFRNRVGIGIATPTANLSVTNTLGTELTGTAASTTFRTYSGSLGTTAGNTLKLASFGFGSSNQSSLGIEALRRVNGTDWTTTGILLKMDVDATSPVNNALIALSSNGNVGVGTTAPVSKLDVEGEIRQLGIIKIDNAAETTYEWEVSEYIIEATPAVVGVVRPMNMTYVNQLCKDKNGCSVTIQMVNWDGTQNIASREERLFISLSNNNWRFCNNDISGTDSNSGANEWGAWDCYFTDTETTGGANARTDNAVGFGLLNASGGSYSDATTTCRIVIRD